MSKMIGFALALVPMVIAPVVPESRARALVGAEEILRVPVAVTELLVILTVFPTVSEPSVLTLNTEVPALV